MALMNFKNAFGSAATSPSAGFDIQRSDLFHVQLALPAALGGRGAWDNLIAFAVEKWPFPERSRESVPVKFMNQTNFQVGADTPTPAVNMTVRYVFSQQTFVLLEQWHWLTSNPLTGGVGLASQIKTDGYFWWYIPAPIGTDFSATSDANAMAVGGCFKLEGCMIKGFKPSDADMTTTNGLVTAEFGIQCDRYYAADPEGNGNPSALAPILPTVAPNQ